MQGKPGNSSLATHNSEPRAPQPSLNTLQASSSPVHHFTFYPGPPFLPPPSLKQCAAFFQISFCTRTICDDQATLCLVMHSIWTAASNPLLCSFLLFFLSFLNKVKCKTNKNWEEGRGGGKEIVFWNSVLEATASPDGRSVSTYTHANTLVKKFHCKVHVQLLQLSELK